MTEYLRLSIVWRVFIDPDFPFSSPELFKMYARRSLFRDMTEFESELAIKELPDVGSDEHVLLILDWDIIVPQTEAYQRDQILAQLKEYAMRQLQTRIAYFATVQQIKIWEKDKTTGIWVQPKEPGNALPQN